MEITVTNRQRRVGLDIIRLRALASAAIGECVQRSGDGLFALARVPLVEVAVVSDAAIARVHRRFMNIPGATDVITFEHGEIVVSADTAERCAAEHGHSPVEELALYIVHGLLHLNGFDDRDSADRRRMHRVQDRIWRKIRDRVRADGR